MLAKGDLKFTLDGEKLHGSWVLVRMRGDRNSARQAHQLAADQASRQICQGRRWRGDPEKGSFGGVGPRHGRRSPRARARSPSPSCAARTLHAPMRSGIKPQERRRWMKNLAKAKSKPPQGKMVKVAAPLRRAATCAGWWSSRRPARTGCMRSSSTAIACSCGSKNGKARLFTRKGLDWTDKFAAIAKAAAKAARLHPGRRGLRAGPQWRAGFRGAAGGAVGRQDRRADLLRLRSAVRGRRGSARPAPHRPARRGWQSC